MLTKRTAGSRNATARSLNKVKQPRFKPTLQTQTKELAKRLNINVLTTIS